MLIYPHLADRAEERAAILLGILNEHDLPTGRLTEPELRRVVLAVAERPSFYRDLVAEDPDGRWWMALHVADNFEVRVLSWGRNQESDWHDHGGSSGAFVVTGGSLVERVRGGDDVSIHERRLAAGQSSSFGPSHVHDVRNGRGRPAVSIHAYSPPLTALTYYDHSPLGFVARDVVPEERRGAFELPC